MKQRSIARADMLFFKGSDRAQMPDEQPYHVLDMPIT
jgi:hypothetical protein